MLNKVSLLPETQTFEQRCGGGILGVRDRGNSMLAQSAENKIQQASECLRGVAPTLMARRESDANLHLPRVIQLTVQTAIAHHDLGRLLDNSQLKPCSGNIWFSVKLLVDQPCCITRPE